MALLDTDIIVSALRGDKEASRKISSFANLNVTVSTTTINTFELFKGAYLSKSKDNNLKIILELLNSINVHDFDSKSSFIAGKLSAELTRTGKQVGENDIMIASIALSNNEVLITRNVKHFENVKELKIENW